MQVPYIDAFLLEIKEGKEEERDAIKAKREAYALGIKGRYDPDVEAWMLDCQFDYKITTLEREITSLKAIHSQAIRVGPRAPPKAGTWKVAFEKAKRAQIDDVAAMFMDIRNPNRNQLCPFHQEKTPSFRIYTKSNRFVCYGCGLRGSPIDLVMQFTGCTFKEAVYRIAS